jgi:hypothetical protein
VGARVWAPDPWWSALLAAGVAWLLVWIVAGDSFRFVERRRRLAVRWLALAGIASNLWPVALAALAGALQLVGLDLLAIAGWLLVMLAGELARRPDPPAGRRARK